MSDDKPTVEFTESGSITVGTVSGATSLDGMNVEDFGNQVMDFLRGKSDLQLLLNFEHIAYMSSAGLTELLRINEALLDSGGSVRLCNLNCDIHKVFRITNLEKLFSVHEDENVDMAVQRFERLLSIAREEDAWAGQDAGA